MGGTLSARQRAHLPFQELDHHAEVFLADVFRPADAGQAGNIHVNPRVRLGHAAFLQQAAQGRHDFAELT